MMSTPDIAKEVFSTETPGLSPYPIGTSKVGSAEQSCGKTAEKASQNTQLVETRSHPPNQTKQYIYIYISYTYIYIYIVIIYLISKKWPSVTNPPALQRRSAAFPLLPWHPMVRRAESRRAIWSLRVAGLGQQLTPGRRQARQREAEKSIQNACFGVARFGPETGVARAMNLPESQKAFLVEAANMV